jgi:hypothetical protein
MAQEPSTLANRLRDALAMHPQNLSKFFATLTSEEQQEIRQMIILTEELSVRGLTSAFKVSTHRLPDSRDPVDELRAAFSDLVFLAMTRLTTHGKEELFGRWMEILTQKLRSRKNAVMLRWLQMAPTMSKRKFTEMIAKENDAYPQDERQGWTSINPEDIKSLLNAELRQLRAQEEPPHLSVIEGGRKTP